jgi:hypothetical protein
VLKRKPMKKTPIKHFVEEALDALQFLDERSGPRSVQEYVLVLTAIQAELGKRIAAAIETIDE